MVALRGPLVPPSSRTIRTSSSLAIRTLGTGLGSVCWAVLLKRGSTTAMVAGLVSLRGPRLVTLAVVSVVLLYDRQVVELALLQPQWGARRSERI